MNTRTVPDVPGTSRRTPVPARLACLTLLVLSQSGWAGSTSAALNIRMTLVDRCDVRPQPGVQGADARCSSGVARAVTVVHVPEVPAPAAPAATGLAATSQPLPNDTRGKQDLVAIVF